MVQVKLTPPVPVLANLTPSAMAMSLASLAPTRPAVRQVEEPQMLQVEKSQM